MERGSQGNELNTEFARELTRRRFMAAVGLAASLAGLAPHVSQAAQNSGLATPTADQERGEKLTALSKQLCGGGTFDAALAASLLTLLNSDAKLSQGLDELLAMPAETLLSATPPATSANAETTSQAILQFWYAGSFNGNPIVDRAAGYTQLIAWQAMYTPSWTTCKLYGGWADAPTLAPQVPENS
jgi:hypothetical protein